MIRNSLIFNYPFSIFNCLYLLYFNFRKALSVALLPFVLFAAFLFENNDLVRFAVADDGRLNGSGADLVANDQRIEINLLAFFFTDLRDTKRHSAFDRKLLTACFDDCVTPLLCSILSIEGNCGGNRKVQIIRKTKMEVKVETSQGSWSV